MPDPAPHPRTSPPSLLRIVRRIIPAATLLCLVTSPVAAAPSPAGVEFFEKKVRPLLAANCYSCHGEEKQKSRLRLDSPAAIRAGGERGPIVVPGRPGESRLLTVVGYQDEELKMPPKQRLSASQVADLTAWVNMGAPLPDSDAAVAAAPARKEFRITDKDRAHWAFQAVRRPVIPPTGARASLSLSPIDSFVLARLESKGLQPNPPAGKRELLRRATYDLTGLPPSEAEMRSFLADNAPGAWERVIDRLLDSPRYGEKWGRHWLDLARFAESNSYERDGAKPHAWRYRDYVIRSFNADKPYDQFIREQLAGDELPGAEGDALVATGYYRLGIWDDEPSDREQARYDSLDDIVGTTSQVFLGLTVDCARCHHHKIDPIPQADYYRLLSFFQNINHYRNGGPTDEAPFFATAADRQAHAARVEAVRARRNSLQAAIQEAQALFRSSFPGLEKATAAELDRQIQAEGRRVLGAERYDRYLGWKKELDQVRDDPAPAEKALVVSEPGPKAPDTFILIRGNPAVKGEKVEPGFLEVLNPPRPAIQGGAAGAKTSGRRTALANWIASPDNPLTARVMANRIWQHHFGHGLVRSPNNFGLQGDRPTHPELLDWLASELVAHGWRLKPMHRLLMTSAAYCRSSQGQTHALSVDPANDLLWRFDLRRLTAEEMRDSILAISGSLNLKMFGPGVYVEIPKEVMAGQSQPGSGWGKSSPEEQGRRSIYIHAKRSLLTPILESFDLAETDRSAPVRFTTIQPTQALGMLNGRFLNQQAERFAARLRREAGLNPEEQVRRALLLATSRSPAPSEVRRGVELISSLRTDEGTSPELALKYFCLMALNLNELAFLD